MLLLHKSIQLGLTLWNLFIRIPYWIWIQIIFAATRFCITFWLVLFVIITGSRYYKAITFSTNTLNFPRLDGRIWIYGFVLNSFTVERHIFLAAKSKEVNVSVIWYWSSNDTDQNLYTFYIMSIIWIRASPKALCTIKFKSLYMQESPSSLPWLHQIHYSSHPKTY